MSLNYLNPKTPKSRKPQNLENPKISKTPNPKTRTQSAFGLLTIKDQSCASYGRRPEVSSVIDFVELGFEAFALSIILYRSSLPMMS
jgi:hypothetical protein